MSALNTFSAHELARLIREGKTTPSAVMEAHLDRIALREGDVGAFQYIDPDLAMRRAIAADNTAATGPLHGVPFAIKDIIDTKDMPTGWGCAAYADRQSAKHATCVHKFIDAGAIPIGKTVTTEFAYFLPGKTANPHNIAHTPGGSSSGSAAAVADYMVPLALGSQTAASLIRPAAYCGVTAFRPTAGGFDLTGVMPLSPSLDTLGVLARDPRDLILMRAVLTDTTPPAHSGSMGELPRIGLMRGPHWKDGSTEMHDVCTAAFAAIEAAGARTAEVAYPQLFAQLTDAQITVMAYEVARTRAQEYETLKTSISPQFTALIEAGQRVTGAEYQAALAIRDRANELLDTLFEDFDALLVPSAPGPAPKGLQATGDPLFSRMWNLLQVPCVALPVGLNSDNLPLGIQLIARRGEDASLLDIATWVGGVLTA